VRALSLFVGVIEVMRWRKVVKVANARIVGAVVVLARLATYTKWEDGWWEQ